MKKITAFLLTSFFNFHFLNAQNYPSSADIYLGLKKLNVLGSVLYIAAHPDDENTRLLTFFSKDRLYRTGYLSLTRGDGGQNLLGEEQGVELGMIRTQELLSARKIDGAEQFFTRAYDFGYSKNPDETFHHWDKEKILSDVVWTIRKFQPDVIITRFPTTGEGGHGQHTASAILALEAFTAAADPKRFPEHLKYVEPWQAKRILWNTFNFGSLNLTNSDQFHFDVGGYNPVLGKSYGEIASESRSQHKSQGFGVPRSRGEALEFFKIMGGPSPELDPEEGVDISWNRIRGAEGIAAKVNAILASFDFMEPQKSVASLVQLYKIIEALPANPWKEQKLRETKNLIEAAGGLWVEAFTNELYAVQGDSIKINVLVNDRLGAGFTLQEFSVDRYDTVLKTSLVKNRNLVFNKTIYVPVDKEISQPYWLKEKMNEGYFEVNDQQLIGQPDIQQAYFAVFKLTFNGETITITKPVRFKSTDPVKGEIYQPVFIVPAATISAAPSNLLFRKGMKVTGDVLLQVNANKKISANADVHLKSAVYDLNKKDTSFKLTRNNSKVFSFILDAEKMENMEKDVLYANASFMERNKEQIAFLTMRSINYDHIPYIRYFYAPSVKVINADLKTYGKKIGYIVGAGDKVPEALEQMGYEVTMLNERELSRFSLQQFDAIISGVRAYNTDDWLVKYYDKLIHYIEEGGNYIVQYSQANNIRSKIGPYNFTVSPKRITDENARVIFLKPEHPVLNYPNKINENDFKGWVQERSVYHADNIDPHFETIFRMNDPGEASDDGSLIISKFGKGYFSYTGLVFFRELPAGVAGAYRLLANLIALNHKKEF